MNFPKLHLAVGLFLVMSGCKARKNQSLELAPPKQIVLTEISTDETYGYTSENPINVGNKTSMGGPGDQRNYLLNLLGPNGENIAYSRLGSCCPFETPNGLMNNTGLLDKYEIRYEGLEEAIVLYINLYDAGELKAPVGFLLKGR